jgi:hypothetical protein
MVKTPRAATIPDRERARAILADQWTHVLSNDKSESSDEIKALVNSNQTAIRFCLPTQLLGKIVEPALDVMCLQRGDGAAGRWDPRGFSVAVIVPWNRTNQNVLGPSGDPYVSNPLRRPRVDYGLDQMSDPEQWERLRDVFMEVQLSDDPKFTEDVFIQVLSAIRDRLRELTFVYVLPPRISFKQADDLVKAFLTERSGGDRGLAVAAALFTAIGRRLGIYQQVKRGVINAADAATNSAGDLECIGPNGDIVLVVEVKERRIGDADVQIAVSKARLFSIRELLLCTEGIQLSDQTAVEKSFANAWASGTNLYHATIGELMVGALPILGESGIHVFTAEIGSQLDHFSTQPRHRKAWKSLLDGL